MNIASSLRSTAAGLVAAFCIVAPAYGAAYIKFEGVDGESKFEEGAIDLEAFAYDVISPRDAASGLATGKRIADDNSNSSRDSASGLPTGKRQHKPVFSDITLTKQMDKASPQLFLKCVTGTHIAQAVLTCRKTGGDGQPYLKVTFKDLIISSYSTSGGEDEDCDDIEIREGTCSSLPTEQFSISFDKVTYEWMIPTNSGETIYETLSYDLTAKPGKQK